MKFVRILQNGFLDAVSVPILPVRGGVWLSSDRLRALSVGAMRSQVSHRVEAVRVARWSGDRCGSGIQAASLARLTTRAAARPWWASVGLHTVMAAQAGCADSKVKPGWAGSTLPLEK
jgi:hypothetical protein